MNNRVGWWFRRGWCLQKSNPQQQLCVTIQRILRKLWSKHSSTEVTNERERVLNGLTANGYPGSLSRKCLSNKTKPRQSQERLLGFASFLMWRVRPIRSSQGAEHDPGRAGNRGSITTRRLDRRPPQEAPLGFMALNFGQRHYQREETVFVAFLLIKLPHTTWDSLTSLPLDIIPLPMGGTLCVT